MEVYKLLVHILHNHSFPSHKPVQKLNKLRERRTDSTILQTANKVLHLGFIFIGSGGHSTMKLY